LGGRRHSAGECIRRISAQVAAKGTVGFDVRYVGSDTLTTIASYHGTVLDVFTATVLAMGWSASLSYRGYMGDTSAARFNRTSLCSHLTCLDALSHGCGLRGISFSRESRTTSGIYESENKGVQNNRERFTAGRVFLGLVINITPPLGCCLADGGQHTCLCRSGF
jgi:hypothetical protein